MLKDFSRENFDIILEAGQSNGSGSGHGDVKSPYIQNENVWYLQASCDDEFIIVPACERVSGNEITGDLSLSFADEYMKHGQLQKGRRLLVIRAAVGATGFSNNRWGIYDDLFLRMIAMLNTAMTMNKNNRIVAFLWHQGENEANFGSSYDCHYNNLSKLLQAVRDVCGNPELPFIAGDFVPQWRDNNKEKCKPIIEAMKAVCTNAGKAAFVDTEGLLSNAQAYDSIETIHFSRQALYQLGERYFVAFLEILNKAFSK